MGTFARKIGTEDFMRVVAVGLILLGGLRLVGVQATSVRLAAAPQVQKVQDLAVSSVANTYCATCHNGSMRSPSGSMLEQFDVNRISANPGLWARAYRHILAGTMPPVGAPRPDRETIAAALASIERELGVGESPMVDASSEVAARLAILLWNSTPDAALLQDVQGDRLSDPGVLERHVRRMLADERAQSFVSRFFFPWLELDKLANADPDRKYFPDYAPSLRDAFARETELFLLSQLRDDRDPIEIWSASYTFVNEQLARHYDISGVSGSQFRRVELPTSQRAGLLGHGSIHMVTSRHQHGVDAAYTTPATRAKWVRAHFLGVPPPNPFPGAQPLKPELPITPQTRTLPTEPCITCHRNFFPLGYALENFDPIGRWRTRDQAGPVDTSGAFVDGAPTNGVNELREVLLQRPDAFRTAITERLLVYSSSGSLGSLRGTPESLVRARHVLRNASNVRWSAIIAEIVRAQPLR